MKKLVLIDGSNFYFKLKGLQIQDKIFDFDEFCRWLTESKQFRCEYYVGTVRQEEGNPKSKKLYGRQQAFLAELRKQRIKVNLGYIIKSDGDYHEKGVDVKIAVDLLIGAYENLYDKAFLVSSDTDLIPAVEKAIAMKKNVEYVGFAHQPSYALIRYCSSTRLLNKGDLEKFIRKK